MNKHDDQDLYHGSGKDKTEIMRHSTEHLMAAAIMSLWPDAKRGVGPAIDTGFYQDFEIPNYQISPSDIIKIENKMRELINRKLEFIKHVKKIDEAIKWEKEKHQDYKIEILEELRKKGEKTVTYYQVGDYIDLCRGPHVEDTRSLGFFKLDKIAGAYWRSNSDRPMLQRLYGICFPTKEELEKYIWQMEEAKKRDHRILGKSLDLFVIDDSIGKGLPLLTSKGETIRKLISDYEYFLAKEYGFEYVRTPHIARSEIYKRTGHWQHYRDVMYEPFGIEGEEYVLKPMNCPHHYMIYESRQRSYKDLPLRYSEEGTCYRFEKTGELSGLLRVRALTIDDAHILMREDQIEEEFKRCIEMVKRMFKALGLNDYYVRLSLPDQSDAVKFIADKKTWERAGQKLEKIVRENNLEFKIGKGEASFYGPKLDYMVKDSLGRYWQMSTLQLDLFMGKRLNLTYTDSDGSLKNPVILHRGLTGSMERTLAILIEHYAGAFPVWLSPVQIMLVPIADRHADFSSQLRKLFISQNIRSESDTRKESMQSKVRDATLQKIPYLGIIGDKEIVRKDNGEYDFENSSISVRTKDGKNRGPVKISEFINQIKKEIEEKL